MVQQRRQRSGQGSDPSREPGFSLKLQKKADQKAKRKKKRNSFVWGSFLVAFVLFLCLVCLGVTLLFFPYLLFLDKEKLKSDFVAGGATTGICAIADQQAGQVLDAKGANYFWPVPTVSRISSQFGPRKSPTPGGSSNHKGIDISIAGGGAALLPFYAMADGQVIYAGPATGYGQVIYVQHAGGVVTKYGHIDSHYEVKRGDMVKKGQRLGRIGAGRVGSSTGPHLHFQVEVNGNPVNPLQYVKFGSSLQPGDGMNKPTLPTPAVPAPAICDSPIVKPGNVDISIAYEPLNIDAMYQYLSTRNGVGTRMGNRSILQMVDRVSKQYGINPYLLLAITGAEQSFVPNNNRNADKIIRNPWNTFGSWQNTDNSTEESAIYAARAIVKLQANKPDNVGPIQWMNMPTGVNPKGFYAADPKWAGNVSVIMQKLKQMGG